MYPAAQLTAWKALRPVVQEHCQVQITLRAMFSARPGTEGDDEERIGRSGDLFDGLPNLPISHLIGIDLLRCIWGNAR